MTVKLELRLKTSERHRRFSCGGTLQKAEHKEKLRTTLCRTAHTFCTLVSFLTYFTKQGLDFLFVLLGKNRLEKNTRKALLVL